MKNSAPSLKIFRTEFSTSALNNGRNKNRRQNLLKQLFHSPLFGYEVIITNSRYALVGYFITSYPTRGHGIMVIYQEIFKVRE